MIFDILLLFVLILAFTALGMRIFKLMRMEFSSFMEEIAFSFTMGAGVIALLTLGIGLLGGLKIWLFYIIISGLLAILILDVREILVRGIRWIRTKKAWMRPFDIALLSIIALNLFMTFFCALAPRVDWDSLAHHLLVPKLYIQSGSIYNMFSPGGAAISQSNYPSNMEMLFMVGMLLKSDILATLIAWSISIFLSLSVYSLSRQFLSPRTSLIAAVILYCSPMIIFHATYTTVDTGVALFAILALYSAIKWIYSGNINFLIFSGVYAGFCVGTKYTGIPVVLVLAVLAFLMYAIERRKPISGIKYSLLFGVIALAVAVPWYVKNYIYAGNPFYPFLAKVFGGRNIPGGLSGHAVSTPWKGIDDYGKWYSLLIGYIRFPWDLTMMKPPFFKMDTIGLSYILFIPCLIFIRNIPRNVKYLLLFGLSGLSVVFALAQRPRYMFQFIPPLAIVASYSLYRISQWDRLLKRVAFSILIAAMLLNMTLSAILIDYKWRVVLGLEPRQEHILRRISNYEVTLFVNEKLPTSSRILTTDPRLYYCEVPAIYDETVIDYESLQGDEMKLLEQFNKLGVSWVLLNPTFITGSRGGDTTMMDLCKKLFDQGKLELIFAKGGFYIYKLA